MTLFVLKSTSWFLQLVPETSGAMETAIQSRLSRCWCLEQNGSKYQVVSYTRKNRKLEPGAILGRGLFQSNDFIRVSYTTRYLAVLAKTINFVLPLTKVFTCFFYYVYVSI